MALDVARLEKVRHSPAGKITARCPACAEDGGDRTGNHLVIFPDEKFACAARAGDGDHRKRIMALVGIRSEVTFDAEQRRQWWKEKHATRQRSIGKQRLANSARHRRQELIRQYGWLREEVWEDSPQRIDSDLVAMDPAHFLGSLFLPDDLLWTGEVHQSGSDWHAERWKTCSEWAATSTRIGPMTTPAVWMPGTISRASNNVLRSPYVVLDFDGFDGIKPITPDELSRHVLDSLAIIRWLREAMAWQLAAILWTGGKSLHAWFHTPPPEVLKSLLPVAQSLGMDAGLIGRPEHPCRLSGQVHKGSGKVSRVMWVQARTQ
ncbi:hypothetical protein [Luteolibacter soli]|uniref:DNA primase n=1 Tax=Luteolibacter soli TaxID=3135280 RepID=A0ABU9B4T3_9BACT